MLKLGEERDIQFFIRIDKQSKASELGPFTITLDCPTGGIGIFLNHEDLNRIHEAIALLLTQNKGH